MSGFVLILVAFIAGYGFVVWRRAEGGSILDVARQAMAQIKARIDGDHLISPQAPPVPPDLFTVIGRNAFHEPEAPAASPRTRTRRQRGGVGIGPMPEGGGRVRNPNAPCWLCGQRKTPDHKCI